jgi:hypothetical protein
MDRDRRGAAAGPGRPGPPSRACDASLDGLGSQSEFVGARAAGTRGRHTHSVNGRSLSQLGGAGLWTLVRLASECRLHARLHARLAVSTLAEGISHQL